ncbi:branched-chain amino acid ABC transporter permease [Kitasatospora atroaurantiaca]|uniref:Amino acid/amide ABC transporter membrane protein 2 (HAAT family) n=1 Tax=Kitasatospora atroaurantiaca TaxID=285545 RepID=A0A561ELM1_9ACTN|nr:branched-chain amino acid ABC transporter permease [Kitasatospora atroaurantiaca]TWE16508.1 amino acid/amide ABC transporter membrane protein 2 (HAAT family) [Kitasatospora atroaurantiaca]
MSTITRRVIPMPPAAAKALVAGGGLAAAASTFIHWTWTSEFPGDLTVDGYPGGLQVLTLVAGLLTTLFALPLYGVKGTRWLSPAGPEAAALLMATATLATTWYTLIAISAELGGVANLEPGGYVAGLASLLPLIGALGLPHRSAAIGFPRLGGVVSQIRYGLTALNRLVGPRPDVPAVKPLNRWVEVLIIIGAAAVGLTVFTYGITTEYGELFSGFLILTALGAWTLVRSGLAGRLTAITARHRGTSTAAAFAAAAAFPFTQSDDHFATVGVNILIFATVALGLNVVVGLAGLLDLGYVAFLGVGAYAAALVSGSSSSPVGLHFPFWAAALTGMAAALVFGVVIGAPTLRLRGDYLAIVTLGFGEIFRIAVNSLDGISGPKVTNGPNGIRNIPDLDILGFNFGIEHTFGSFTLGRFANYFLLMLLFTGIVVVVFSRANDSRIGRAWVAIREDETAAQAMGINGFKLKLLAFALGASLAGLAGTVMAHVSYSVVPDPYQFAASVPPNSAFLVAAVVLGGMGTISGPLVGATLLYLIPEKLVFLKNYQLLFFGIALVLLMRLRPEGLIAGRRQQLEFHEDDESQEPAEPGEPVLTKAGA